MGLTEDIVAGAVGPAYLVLSEEEYLRVDATRRWLAALNQVATPKAHFFRAPRWDLAAIEGLMMTVPLFDELTALILHDVDRLPAGQQKRLLELLAQSSPHVRIMMTAAALDKRRSFYKGLAKQVTVESFNRIYDNQRPGWVTRIAGNFGWSISPDAALAVTELVGEDLMGYEAELKKIILYIGEQRRIELRDVEEVLFSEARFGGFALIDAFGKRDVSRVLRIIREVYAAPGAKSSWMPMLASGLFRLIRIKALSNSHSDREIATELGLNPYVVKLLREQAARFSRDQLLNAIHRLYRAELDIKTSALPGTLAAELMLLHTLVPPDQERSTANQSRKR